MNRTTLRKILVASALANTLAARKQMDGALTKEQREQQLRAGGYGGWCH